MKNFTRLLLTIGTGFALSPLTVAKAQPNLRDAPKGNNPANWIQPEEQMKLIQARREELRLSSLRQRLTKAGFTDAVLQDTVVAFAKDNESARVALETQWQNLNKAMQQNNLTDAQIAALLKNFEEKADEEKARRKLAQQQFSEKIGLEDKPRLKILLISMGVLGEESALLKKDYGMETGGVVFRF